MLLLGLNVPSFWHPGWLLCLAGVVCAFVELAVFVTKKARLKNKKESQAIEDKYEVEDQKYWTEWDD